jgi:hypothetical protein
LKLKINLDIDKKALPQNWPSFFMLGSCFASNQSEKLSELGFNVSANPFGIIYNPVSISSLLFRLSENKQYTEEDFVHYTKYFCLEHHGKFKFDSLEGAIQKSNQGFNQARESIISSDVIVLTYGTSLVFHNTVHKKIVANCHKLPNKDFELIQLQLVTLKNSIVNCVSEIRKMNKDAHIVFTVSPVRHLRSGIIENSRSKASIIAALHETLNDLDNASYFPSYEILIDELRDYRFTKDDMMHPTEQAQTYILERFLDTYLNKQGLEIISDIEKFNRFANHKALTSPELHANQVLEKRKELLSKHPFLNLK